MDDDENGIEDRSFPRKTGLLKNNYHGQEVTMTDEFTQARIGGDHLSEGHTYAADRESTDLLPFLERPVTVMYPYEALRTWSHGYLFQEITMVGLGLFGKLAPLVRHA